jgi:hypothetical protein
MSRAILSMAIIVSVLSTVRADESISPEIVDHVKKATVFIRIESDTSISSGSGFVIGSDGKNVLIATNHHVAVPKASPNAKTSIEAKAAPITVVFDSGTKTPAVVHGYSGGK